MKVPENRARRLTSVSGDIGNLSLNFAFLQKVASKHNSSKISLQKNPSIESYFSSKKHEISKQEETKQVVGNDGLPIVNEKSLSTSSSNSR